ncbi:MAG: hypothetical protein ACOZNI_30960, partial [Myxococcota bacterium]
TGDLDGDGAPDLLFCAVGDGASGIDSVCAPVSVADLAAGGDHAPDTAGFSVYSDNRDSLLGAAAVLEDSDADGDTDLWLGAPAGVGEVFWFGRE